MLIHHSILFLWTRSVKRELLNLCAVAWRFRLPFFGRGASLWNRERGPPGSELRTPVGAEAHFIFWRRSVAGYYLGTFGGSWFCYASRYFVRGNVGDIAVHKCEFLTLELSFELGYQAIGESGWRLTRDSKVYNCIALPPNPIQLQRLRPDSGILRFRDRCRLPTNFLIRKH